jgi:ABC-type polysaccharide/polyol phosphate export permease
MHQIKAFLYFLKMIYQQRYVIKKLVIRDFQKKYLGSYLGLPWAFMQPAAIILVLWVVITFGLRGGSSGDVPFLPWFIGGMIPWFFVQESVISSSNSLLSYSFLIKQMYFRVGIIPIITIITALIIHLFLVLILMIIVSLYGFLPSIHWIQFPYYLTGTFFLMAGLGWLFSALMVFVKDVKQIISIFITLFFWLTPIIWPHDRLTGSARLIVDLNPFFYITNGYRETFITHEWFFENVLLTLYFWGFVAFMFIAGALIFHRLKPHFADVL